MSRRTLRVFRVGHAVLIECDQCGPLGVLEGSDMAAQTAAAEHLHAHGATNVAIKD